jgi:hypothetical protein
MDGDDHEELGGGKEGRIWNKWVGKKVKERDELWGKLGKKRNEISNLVGTWEEYQYNK